MDLSPSTNEIIFTLGEGGDGFHLHSNQQGNGFHKHYHDQANI
jgi:hypothetical protein